MTGAHDRLLWYLSEKGEGSWAELKDAWEWIKDGRSDDPAERAWIAARDLEALGHIEVAWDRELQWCAAPPVLTMIPRSGGRVFLTGTRTRFLLERLHVEAESRDLWVDECPTPRGPTSVYIACETVSDAEGLAAALGMTYSYQVAEQISRLLPPLDTYFRLFDNRELPRGLEAERFDEEALRWLDTSELREPALYRVRTYEGHLHGLLDAAGSWHRVIKEIGIYEVLRWQGRTILEYDEGNETLALPAGAALPALHARTATLCSGRLPKFVRAGNATSRAQQAGGRFQAARRNLRAGAASAVATAPAEPSRAMGKLTYANVPAEIAERIAGSLSQGLGA